MAEPGAGQGRARQGSYGIPLLPLTFPNTAVMVRDQPKQPARE